MMPLPIALIIFSLLFLPNKSVTIFVAMGLMFRTDLFAIFAVPHKENMSEWGMATKTDESSVVHAAFFKRRLFCGDQRRSSIGFITSSLFGQHNKTIPGITESVKKAIFGIQRAMVT